jgi:hypothetical protein
VNEIMLSTREDTKRERVDDAGQLKQAGKRTVEYQKEWKAGAERALALRRAGKKKSGRGKMMSGLAPDAAAADE